MSTLAATVLGVVLIGPSCSGPEVEGRACPSLPWVGVGVRMVPEGLPRARRMLELATDAHGHFEASLDAGRWRVEVLAAKPTRCPALVLELPRSAGAPVPTIDCDSGRR